MQVVGGPMLFSKLGGDGDVGKEAFGRICEGVKRVIEGGAVGTKVPAKTRTKTLNKKQLVEKKAPKVMGRRKTARKSGK